MLHLGYTKFIQINVQDTICKCEGTGKVKRKQIVITGNKTL